MIGYSHGSEPFADTANATGNGNGMFSSYTGLAWTPTGGLTWNDASASRILAIPGETCGNPLVITGLPYTTTDNTGNYGDDYSSSDRPPLAPGAVGNPSGSYLGGDDVVYAYTPTSNGVINIYVSNHADWTGLFVFTGCPFASTVGGHTNSSASTVLTVESLPVTAGETYYIVISTWPSPQSTAYTLTVEADVFDCPELEANYGDPCDDGDPNTVGDIINENCECEGIVPGPGADCAEAISLVCNGDPVTYSSIGSTATNTTTCTMGNAGLWFTFTGTGNTITINSTAAFDHEMSINSGACGQLTNIACKDGSTGAETYTLATTVSGQEYYVYIAHFASGNSTTGNITVSLVCATEFDCPELQKNIGDSCDLGGGETGVVDANCNCVEISCQNSTRWPSATVTPNADGSSTQIAGCNFYGEYSEIGGIISGYEYQFDAVQGTTSGYITVREGSVGGSVVAKGYGPLTITAPSSSNLFVHWNSNDTCGTGSNCVVTTVSCVTCANAPDCEGVPGGPAQPGTPCDDGDPNTFNDVYDEDCNCAGVVLGPGDDCSMAIALDCNAEAQTFSSANSLATNTTTCLMGAKGIWFSFEGTGADITVNSSATFDHEMSINTGSCGELINIACKDGSTGAETYTVAGTVAGQTYYVYIAHYSSSGTTTGNITISLDCAVVPECEAPALTLAAQDANGGSIECLEAGGEYYVLATLSGGSGNTSYNVSANGGDTVEVAADGSTVFGPYTVGSNVSVTATGAQDGDCSVTTAINSPAYCPPVNETCAGAIALDCNAEPMTYSSMGSTATAPAGCTIGAKGIWFSFVGTGADITINSTASFDHKMSMQTGSCNELTWIACKDGSIGAETYTIEATVANQMYYVYVAHYGTFTNSTGNITISIDCAVVPECEAPALTLAAQDANGGPIECLEAGGEYYVLATLSGGSGNTSYNVSANGGDTVEVAADGSTVFGPYTIGTNVSVTATGAQDGDCSVTTAINSPAYCPPVNETCAGAIALDCNAEPVTYSSMGSTATAPAGCSLGSNGIWFSFMGTGADITVNSSATLDHEMSINTGSCGELVNIGCKDSSNGPESYTIEASVANQMYYVYIAHWSGSSTTTGNITIDIDCAVVPECEAPTLTLTAQDANGGTIEGCIEAGGEYFVLATLSGGSGNTSYYLAANDYDAVEVNADGSVVFGPFDVGTTVNASAIGVQDDDCVAYATLESPNICGPVNEDCDGAIVLECNADPVTYSSEFSNATNTTDCTMGNKGLWFSFVGTGGDITVNSSATFDHEMSVNSGSCEDLVNLVCKDSAFSGGTETYTIEDSTEGEMYYVYIASWANGSTTTGDITISIDCAIVPECVAPELTLVAQDANGGSIDCLEVGGEYFVLATLSGGSGNTSYNVSANGGDAVEVNADGSTVFGPFTEGTDVDVTAVGVQDDACSVSASSDSPAICPPINNDCADAIALSCGDSVAGTTIGATYSEITDDCTFRTTGDVFYTLAVEAGNEYTVTVQGADYDAVLAIYSGVCGQLTEIACADNGFSAGVAETITFTADATGTVVIRTYDWSTSAGSFTISVDCTVVPECESPLGITVNNITEDGADITWSAANVGDDQWEISLTVGGQGPDEGIIASVSGTPAYTATGLDPATTYTVYLRTVCSSEVSSDWAFNGEFTTLEAEEECESPLGITVDNITEDGAEITWSAANAGDNQWEISLTVGGQTADQGIIATVTGTPIYTATGLDPDTTYTVYLRTICSSEVSSDWAFNGDFTTLEAEEPGSCEGIDAFVTTWTTTASGQSITIPTYSGETYDYTVDWGDGSSNTNVPGNISHTYANAGTYTVSICGTFPRIYFNNGGDRLKIKSIEQWGTNVWSSMNSAFMGAENLVSHATDMPNLSMVTDMYGMFAFARKFNGDAQFGNWNVGNVTDMMGMFAGASIFNYPIGGWNVGNVTTMESMFFGATIFNQPLGNWNVSSVTTMRSMFQTAYEFNQSLNNWNVGNVTDMYGMFAYARKFNGEIGNWNVGNVTNMTGMFGAASKFNKPIGNWNVGNVTSMEQMFHGATVFNQDLGAWNVGNVTNMRNMFATAMKFNYDIGNWNVGNVTNMFRMFFHANSFDQDLGGWNVSNVTDMTNMFVNVKLSTANYDSLLNGWSALPLQHNVKFHGGKSKYCAGEAGRNIMTGTPYNWIIQDGGMDCSNPFNGDRLDTGDSAALFGVSLYPNPMKDQLNLGNPKNVELESVSIFDLTGRMVQKVDLNGITTGTVIDVSRLSSATYMVLVKGKYGQTTELLIKE